MLIKLMHALKNNNAFLLFLSVAAKPKIMSPLSNQPCFAYSENAPHPLHLISEKSKIIHSQSTVSHCKWCCCCCSPERDIRYIKGSQPSQAHNCFTPQTSDSSAYICQNEDISPITRQQRGGDILTLFHLLVVTNMDKITAYVHCVQFFMVQ